MLHLILALTFGALVAPAQITPQTQKGKEIVVVYKDGTTISAKLPAIAGKVTLLPGNVTLVEGQSIRLAFIVKGGMDSFRLEGVPEGAIFGYKKVTEITGGVVYIFSEELFFPPGEHTIKITCYNGRGNFSHQVRMEVIGAPPIGIHGGENKSQKDE